MNGKNKKVVAGTVALSMALSGAIYATADSSKVNGSIADTAAAAKAFLNGDVNEDGEVTLDDAQLALKGALKIKTDFTNTQLYAADVDSSKELTLDDAQMILKAALMIEQLPAKEAPIAPEASEIPNASQTPDGTVEPEQSETPVESKAPDTEVVTSRKPMPSEDANVVVSRPPAPKAPTLEAVEPADYVVTGQAVKMIATNGAIETDGIFTFTDDNKEAMSGIEFEWPFSGRKDLRQTVEEAGVTVEDTLSVPKEYTEQGTLEKMLAADGTIDYSMFKRPQWTNGVSISFWSKQKWTLGDRSNVGPLLVIKRSYYCDWCYETNYDPGYGGPIKHHTQPEDCDFGLVVYANGTVTFAGGDEAKNSFHAGSYYADKDNEWTHYTITIANDFITVYVNGQEMVYQSINLDKDASGECFNDGFMTRYNPIGIVTQDMLDQDVRGYLTAPVIGSTKNSAYYELNGKFVTNWEATLLGNGRYKEGPDSAGYMLLMDLLTQDHVQMYLGGRPVDEVCCIKSSGTGYAEYNTPSGSQATGLMCYEKELKADEVAAVYEDSKAQYKELLKLD